jgi:hypothetical protein
MRRRSNLKGVTIQRGLKCMKLKNLHWIHHQEISGEDTVGWKGLVKCGD